MNKKPLKVETEKKHVCSQCGSAFNRPYRLKQHEKKHLNIKEFVCGEPNCKKSYTNKSHLDRHIYSTHLESALNVIYSCPNCTKVYANRQNLKRHIKLHHGRKTGFTCDVCQHHFKKKHQLSAHMYKHTFIKSFSCELCSCEFITLLEKKKHMKYHKTYSCDLCDMAFVQWSKYLKHKKMTHKVYKCDDCGRKFNQRAFMVRHSKTHNTRYTPKFHPCTYENCDRAYTRNSNLKQHIKMKHLKVRHECEICCAKLSTKAKLLLHIKTHSKSKEFMLQPTIETGRKERCDKGTARTSTALKIAGLVLDPENEHIRGTLKSIADSVTEQDTAESATTKDISAESTAGPDNKADSSSKHNSITCETIELPNLEKEQNSICVKPINCHETQKTCFQDHSIKKICELNVCIAK